MQAQFEEPKRSQVKMFFMNLLHSKEHQSEMVKTH